MKDEKAKSSAKPLKKYPKVNKYCNNCLCTRVFIQKKEYVYCSRCDYRMELE